MNAKRRINQQKYFHTSLLKILDNSYITFLRRTQV